MRVTRRFTAVVLAAGMTAGVYGFAQPAMASAQGSTQAQGTSPTWTMEQLITSSVHDAWVMSGRNEEMFFKMVSQLAQISAQKRGLTLPDTEAAGKKFGHLVKTMAKADTDQLLYIVVDKAVQQVGTRS